MSSGLIPPSLARFLPSVPCVCERFCLTPILSSQPLHPDLRKQQGQIPIFSLICAFEGLGVAVIAKLFPFDRVHVILDPKGSYYIGPP